MGTLLLVRDGSPAGATDERHAVDVLVALALSDRAGDEEAMNEFSDPTWASADAISRSGTVPDGLCDDCDKGIRLGGHTCNTGEQSRRYCDPCYQWRSKHLLVFDPRPRLVLERLVA